MVLCDWRLADNSHSLLSGAFSVRYNRLHFLHKRYPDVPGDSLQIRTCLKSFRFYRKDQQKGRFLHQPKGNISSTTGLSIKTLRRGSLKKASVFDSGPVPVQITKNDDNNADSASMHHYLLILRACPDA